MATLSSKLTSLANFLLFLKLQFELFFFSGSSYRFLCRMFWPWRLAECDQRMAAFLLSRFFHTLFLIDTLRKVFTEQSSRFSIPHRCWIVRFISWGPFSVVILCCGVFVSAHINEGMEVLKLEKKLDSSQSQNAIAISAGQKNYSYGHLLQSAFQISKMMHHGEGVKSTKSNGTVVGSEVQELWRIIAASNCQVR